MKRTLVAFVLTLPMATSAQEWAWEAVQQSYNGVVAVQSASGGMTHTLPQNPLAAVAKTDQSAVTQPPTIIVQATGSSQPFNYKDDCFVLSLSGEPENFIGAGKTSSSNHFTGLLASIGANTNSSATIVSMLTNGHFAGGASFAAFTIWCGSDANCVKAKAHTTVIQASYSGASGFPVIAVANLPTTGATRCYP